jgi:inorganic triphosphatase YgiF
LTILLLIGFDDVAIAPYIVPSLSSVRVPGGGALSGAALSLYAIAGALVITAILLRFARKHLSRHAAELKSAFAQPLGDQYGDQLIRLARDIDSILLLAGSYDGPVAHAWLENWQGLQHAIKTRQRIEIEHFRNESISQEPFWLHSGKR